jgi:hypothetical protein
MKIFQILKPFFHGIDFNHSFATDFWKKLFNTISGDKADFWYPRDAVQSSTLQFLGVKCN